MRLLWTEQAQLDLIEIGRFIARDKPAAARKWTTDLRRRARQAAELPFSGRRVHELERSDIRELIHRGYRIVYRIGEDEVLVLTIFESHRMLRPEQVEPADPP